MALLSIFAYENGPLVAFLEPLSKLENVVFAPGDRPYNTHYYWGFLTKSALSADPTAVIHVTTPHFRRFRSYEQLTQEHYPCNGRNGQAIEVVAGGLVWAVKVWVWAVKVEVRVEVWVWAVKVEVKVEVWAWAIKVWVWTGIGFDI